MSKQNIKIVIVGAVVGAAIGNLIYNAAKRRREQEERERNLKAANDAVERMARATVMNAQLSANPMTSYLDWRQRCIEESRHRTQIR